MLDNLLGLALSVIPLSPATLKVCKGKQVDDRGKIVYAYEDPVAIRCSIQPLSTATVSELGFDVNKNYVSIHSTAAIKATSQGKGGDLVLWRGSTYQIEHVVKWDERGFTRAYGVQLL